MMRQLLNDHLRTVLRRGLRFVVDGFRDEGRTGHLASLAEIGACVVNSRRMDQPLFQPIQVRRGALAD